MRKLLAFGLLALISLTGTAQAELRIAFVNSEVILSDYTAVRSSRLSIAM